MTRIPLRRDPRGFTFIELLITIAVLGILAAAALPLTQVAAKRTREIELRRSLRTFREGIDRFKIEYDKARASAQDAKEVFKKKVTTDRTGYPLTLEELVETKVLRRLPKDPMTPEGKWTTRSYSDNPDSSLTDNKDVYDVRSASTEKGLDGTRYDAW